MTVPLMLFTLLYSAYSFKYQVSYDPMSHVEYEIGEFGLCKTNTKLAAENYLYLYMWKTPSYCSRQYSVCICLVKQYLVYDKE